MPGSKAGISSELAITCEARRRAESGNGLTARRSSPAIRARRFRIAAYRAAFQEANDNLNRRRAECVRDACAEVAYDEVGYRRGDENAVRLRVTDSMDGLARTRLKVIPQQVCR